MSTPRQKKTRSEWMSSLAYLPAWFRDHHDQKEVFKWIWRRVEKQRADSNGFNHTALKSLDWISAHIFVIDFFLWFMALHGYTLQPARQSFEFNDWQTSIREMKDEDAVAWRAQRDREKEQREKGTST